MRSEVGQLAFDGMPRPLYAAAPSRLTTYLDCPRRYRLDLPRPAAPRRRVRPGAITSVGASVHTALARWWAAAPGPRTPEAGGDLLVARWLHDGFRDHAQLVAARERRARTGRALPRRRRPRRRAGRGRAHRHRSAHRAPSCGAASTGIDDRPGEGVVVVDYKTGRSVLTVDDARMSLALAVYAAGAARTLRRRLHPRRAAPPADRGGCWRWDHTDGVAGATPATGRRARSRARTPRRAAPRPACHRPEADATFPARVAAPVRLVRLPVRCARPGRQVPQQPPWAGVDLG